MVTVIWSSPVRNEGESRYSAGKYEPPEPLIAVALGWKMTKEHHVYKLSWLNPDRFCSRELPTHILEDIMRPSTNRVLLKWVVALVAVSTRCLQAEWRCSLTCIHLFAPSRPMSVPICTFAIRAHPQLKPTPRISTATAEQSLSCALLWRKWEQRPSSASLGTPKRMRAMSPPPHMLKQRCFLMRSLTAQIESTASSHSCGTNRQSREGEWAMSYLK